MPRMKSCPICGNQFQKERMGQKTCRSFECAIAYGRQEQEKARRKENKAKLEAMESLPSLKKKAQTAFNAFIRARDSGKTCISCGNHLHSDLSGGAFDCGHYRSIGSAPHMRFIEENAHGQCKHCNRHLAGNHVEYRKGLIARIGIKAVEAIEADTSTRKYTRENLIEIARHYRAEAKRLRESNG